MRTPTKHVAGDGTVTYKVRFRQGGTQTSETFRREADARTFAAILSSTRDGVTDALMWLAAKETRDATPTFAEWFEHYVDQLTGVQPRTRTDYRAMHRRYLTELDPMPLTTIARGHIAAIVNGLEKDGKSPKTIKNVVHMLSSALGLAVEEGVLTRNPCRRVRLPKDELDVQEVRFLSHDEFRALMVEIPDYYRPLVAFLVGTGMRWSEATALQGRDVDLEAGTVAVRRAWKRIPGVGFVVGPPKTKAGRRTVNAAVIALAAARAVMRGPNDYIFTTPSGGPITHANFHARVWRPAADRSGLDPRPQIKDLRHTHASWLISDGMSLEAVQDQLGHESILTTRKVYAHLLPALGVAVGRSASAALARALPDGIEGLPTLPLAALASGEQSGDADDEGAHVSDG